MIYIEGLYREPSVQPFFVVTSGGGGTGNVSGRPVAGTFCIFIILDLMTLFISFVKQKI